MDSFALYILIGFLVLLAGLNAVATYIVCHTYFRVENRKRKQIIFIWAVPLLGALLAIFLNREDYFAQRQKDRVGNNPHITEAQAVTFGRAENHRAER